MDSQIEEIKNKLNVLDVIGSYMKLTKTGVNYRGVCPFHSEKSPSFFVSPTRQMWHCFGCGAGFSIFDFVMKIEGIEFADALRILAAKAGVQLRRENVQLRTERQRLQEICELATVFYQKQLEGSAVGKEAQAYLVGRGITPESLQKWRVGYSPDLWNSLSDFLVGKGYAREEVIKAGLAIQKENSKDSYDRFRGRIIFPVFDVNGQVVGFGGRVFKQQNETAKYINTPQTLLYDKSNVIYGLHNAKLAVRKQNQCVVTEGYTDVIMCHQAGFENTVAASGTALTGQHLTMLKRYTDNLVLAFDMDVAGDSATKRGINLAQEQGFNIKIIEHYGEGDKKYDPADIILKDVAIWKQSVEHAKSIMDYYVDSALAAFDKDTPQGKKDIGAVVLPAIKRLQNTIEQQYWIQKLAALLQVKEEAVAQELVKVKEPKQYQEAPKPVAPTVMVTGNSEHKRKKLIEEKILLLVFGNPAQISLVKEEQVALFSPEAAAALREIRKTGSAQGVDSQFAPLLLKADEAIQEDADEEIKLCILELERIESKNRQQKMMKEIADQKDEQKKEELIKEFEAEAKKFHSIK